MKLAAVVAAMVAVSVVAILAWAVPFVFLAWLIKIVVF